MKKKGLPILFFVVGSIYLVYIPEGFGQLLLKLLPMCLVITYAFLNGTTSPIRKWILAGLLFCMVGDALILYSFVAGLAAFLIGHVLYTTGFLKVGKLSKRKTLLVIPIALYAIIIGREIVQSLLDGGNQSLAVPVIGYIAIISFMAWTAMMTGNKWAIIGSLLFVMSDSILAWNKFVYEIPLSHMLIMGTYYAAQFFIAHSLLTTTEKRQSYTKAQVAV